MYNRAYNKLVRVGSGLQSPLLLCLRLLWGFLFFMTGLGKFQDLSVVANYFTTLGIPLPELNAFIVATCEMFGGLCLIFGIASRLVALFLMAITAVAFATAEKVALLGFFHDPINFVMRTPFTFFLVSLTIFVFGPGYFSLDHRWKKEK